MRVRLGRCPGRLAAGVLLAAATLAIALTFFIPTPYQLLQPGPAVDANRLIQDGRQPVKSALYLTTIRSSPASFAEWVYAHLRRDRGLVPREQARPRDVSEKDYQHLLTQMMDESKLVAQVVAFRAAGYEVEMTGRGVQVTDFVAGSHAAGSLVKGDVIVGAGGQAVTTVDDLVRVVQRSRPGDELPLSVIRGGGQEPADVAVPLAESSQEPGRAVIGVYVRTYELDYVLPREMRIVTRDIGGSSGGLMLALALYNHITGGDVARGQRIAGTGALDRNGKVLPVGGVRYKVLAAERVGAAQFLVPPENAAEARAAASRVRVVEVDSFDAALGYLNTLPPA